MTTHDAPTLELLLRHQSLVRSIARDLLVDPDAADDVVQQTWLAALRHAARGAQVGRSLLARIATNLAFNRRRDERRRETRERHAANAEPLPSVAELVEREDERRRVVEAVFALREPLRETVLRRYLDDRSVADVAAVLGIPLGTVRSRLRLARTILRERLDKDSDAPRSARGLAALAGWSADEAAAAIAGGKGVLVMGAKAWVGVAAGVAAIAMFGILVRNESDGEHRMPAGGAALAMEPQRERIDTGATADNERIDGGARAAVTTGADPAPSVTPPRMQRPRTIRGRCVTPARTPITGATITSQHFAQSATTDATGRFEFTADLGERSFVVLDADAPGRARVTQQTWIRGHGALTLGEFVMPIAATIRGRVVDESGAPVQALLELRPGGWLNIEWEFGLPTTEREAPGRDVVFAEADGAGSFAFHAIDEDWYSIVATHPEKVATGRVDVAAIEGSNVDVVMRMRSVRDDERIRGRVVDADGAPCAHARVAWKIQPHRGVNSNSIHRGLIADENGTFACIAAAGSEHEFRVLANDETASVFGRPAAATLALVSGVHGGDPEVLLRLEPQRRSTIRVVDANDGSACASATVGAVAVDRSDARYAKTDADGAASMEVPRSAFDIEVTSAMHETVKVGPFDGETIPEIGPIQLVRKPCLRGRVVGCPPEQAAGARITVFTRDPNAPKSERSGFPRSSTVQIAPIRFADDAGVFTIPLGTIEPGATTVVVRAEIAGYAPGHVELPVPLAIDAEPVEVPVTRGGAIEGRVTPPAFRSPAGLVVVAGNDDTEFLTTRVEEDGTYRIENLRPGTWRAAVAFTEPSEMTLFGANPPRTPPDIDVREGQATRVDLAYAVAGLVSIEGIVRFGGNAQRGTRISIMPPEAVKTLARVDRARMAYADVRPSGKFAVEMEVPGTYNVCARLRNESTSMRLDRVVDLVPGANHIAIEVPCGTVTGTCSRPLNGTVNLRGNLADGTSINADATCAADGTFSIPIAPAGSFTIAGAGDAVPIEIRSGETTTVELK